MERKFETARGNILLVIVMTIVNVLLLVLNANTYFLFSAYIPFILADCGMYFCGLYPEEIYTGEMAGVEFLPKAFLVIMLVIVAVILALYFLSWLLSKKQKKGWLVFALIFFTLDTLAMFGLNGFVADSIIDYAIHIWVIVSLVSGISALSKLKKLPAVEEVAAEEISTEVVSETTEVTAESNNEAANETEPEAAIEAEATEEKEEN
ncbi:MAG: hypothetical protein E7593_01610 [Ruminococcaceae bacterium]|nr:hypothetical protein [Oscillospiraceae bacterium]